MKSRPGDGSAYGDIGLDVDDLPRERVDEPDLHIVDTIFEHDHLDRLAASRHVGLEHGADRYLRALRQMSLGDIHGGTGVDGAEGFLRRQIELPLIADLHPTDRLVKPRKHPALAEEEHKRFATTRGGLNHLALLRGDGVFQRHHFPLFHFHRNLLQPLTLHWH